MNAELAPAVGDRAKRPRWFLSAVVGLVFIGATLYLVWVVIPGLVTLGLHARVGASIEAPPIPWLRLVADLLLSFGVALAFMSIAVRSPRLYGMTIATCIAFMKWATFFSTVQGFGGIRASEYPQWYEWLCFLEAPMAVGIVGTLAWRVAARQSAGRKREPPSVLRYFLATLKVTTLAVVLLAGSMFGIGVWEYKAPILDEIQSVRPVASIGRIVRCSTLETPLLRSSTVPWTLSYSWSGGRGPGTFDLKLASDGTAEFTHQAHAESAATALNTVVPPNAVVAIAGGMDDSGVFCLTTKLRERYRVWDLGRFSLTLTQGSYSKTVYVDECHTVSDGPAFDRAVASVTALKSLLGPELGWGPFGTASTSAACSESAEQ